MRKLLALMMSILLVFSVAACGNTPAQDGDSSDIGDGSAAQTSSDTADRPEAPEESGNKVLVVYYSSTGHTQTVARYIAARPARIYLSLCRRSPIRGQI